MYASKWYSAGRRAVSLPVSVMHMMPGSSFETRTCPIRAPDWQEHYSA